MMKLGTPVMAVRWSVREVKCRYLCVLLLADLTDLREVMSAVLDLSVMWPNLGISLGIRMGDLEDILFDIPHSARDCMRMMLILWLRQNYKVHVWTSLIPYCSFLPSWHGELVIRGRRWSRVGRYGELLLQEVPGSQLCCVGEPGMEVEIWLTYTYITIMSSGHGKAPYR